MQASIDLPAGTAPDSELLARFVLSRDEAAFADLVRRHSPLVLAVARRRLGDSGFAEDAAQQVFIAMARRAQKLRSIPCLAAWLHKVTVYEATTIIRREARHRRRALQSSHPEPQANTGPDLDKALAALPAADREILLLHHFEKLPYDRIAARLGISPAAAQKRGSRALAKLAGWLKRRESGTGESACAMWLGASLAPRSTEVPAGFLTRAATLEKAASFSLPWIPLAASLVLGGGAVAAVQAVYKPTPPPSPAASISSNSPRAARPAPRKLQPSLKDEQLAPDMLEFITRAKRDPRDAWAWVKEHKDWNSFFINDAVRNLGERDLAATDRFLEVVDAREARTRIIPSILVCRARESLDSAVLWIDSFAEPYEREMVELARAGYEDLRNGDDDYAGALRFARSPEVRRWLIREACEKSAALDEAGIESLAAELEGGERHLALGHAAAILLERGDPRAFAILNETGLSSTSVPSLWTFARKDPRPVLDWALSRDTEDSRETISVLWRFWSERDAPAAAEWALEMKRRHGLAKTLNLFSGDPIVQRLMDEAP